MKFTLTVIGFVSIMFFIYLLIVGVKVVSTLVFYIVAIIAAISVIVFAVNILNKLIAKNNKQ